MDNLDKLDFAIKTLHDNSAVKSADTVASIEYLRDVVESLKPKKRTKIEVAIADAKLHVKASEREVLIKQTILNERIRFASTLEGINESENF